MVVGVQQVERSAHRNTQGRPGDCYIPASDPLGMSGCVLGRCLRLWVRRSAGWAKRIHCCPHVITAVFGINRGVSI